MHARALLLPLAAVTATALLSCVDTTRPSASPSPDATTDGSASPDATADGSASPDATVEDIACQPPACAPWEVAVDEGGDGCQDTCETRCELDCDCYVALGNPDGACPTLQRSIWACNDHHRCETSCVSLADVPDCHGARALSCRSSDDCPNRALDGRNYCARPPGMCGPHKGLCTSANDDPDKCPENGPPVCGCDGGTYSNVCRAIASGVSVRGPAAMCH